MHTFRKIITLVILTCFTISLGQAQNFGIRAGLNYNKFLAPSDGNLETYSTTGGWHFGVNYAYRLSSNIAIKGELQYTQVGTNYQYSGASFYKVPLSTSTTNLVPNAYLYEKGTTTINMKVSNGYIKVPLLLQVNATDKWEVNLGAYASFLVSPKGSGTLKFVSSASPDSLFFKQSLIHNYNNDEAGGASGGIGPWVFVKGARTPIARDAGAYYNYRSTEWEGKLYKPYDFGITGGVSYFINKGLYIGFRYDFGLVDITNNKVDASRRVYDETNDRLLFSKDFDRNSGFEASFGFKF